MHIASLIATIAIATGLAVTAVGDAEARCTRLAFSVNDYGKDGPIKDAKALLDKYVADWAGKHGIKKYSIGKKDVSCELFLDFVVFDEHTCKASALVCWAGNAGPPDLPTATPAKSTKAAAAKPARKKPVTTAVASGAAKPAASKVAKKPAAKTTATPVKAPVPAMQQ